MVRHPGFLAALVTVVPLAPLVSQTTPVAFVNVNVVPMDRERILRNQTVVIQDGRITVMADAAKALVPSGAVRVDGNGKYLMPGLAEMHAHIPPGQAGTDANIRHVLSLFALNGVTTIRGMLGDPKHLPYRDMAARGDILSPLIYSSGPSFNGNSAPTGDVAVAMVRGQKLAGYDLLKIHPGIRRPVFDSLAATAHEVGIPFAGHVPLDVGVRRAIEARFASIDHVDGYIEALVPEGAPMTGTQSQWFGANLIDHLDWSRLPALVAATRDAGVAIVPTEALFESTSGPLSAEVMASWPEMQYMSRQQIAAWKTQAANTRSATNMDTRGAAFLRVRHRIIKALHEGGVKFLLGSDAPQMWNVPGFSLRHELRGLVAAGLTPYQALESGTRNVAEYLGILEMSGTVAVGKRADLILIDANPLRDAPAAIERQAGVVVGGRWLPKDEVNRQLAALKGQ